VIDNAKIKLNDATGVDNSASKRIDDLKQYASDTSYAAKSFADASNKVFIDQMKTVYNEIDILVDDPTENAKIKMAVQKDILAVRADSSIPNGQKADAIYDRLGIAADYNNYYFEESERRAISNSAANALDTNTSYQHVKEQGMGEKVRKVADEVSKPKGNK
jgi:hypothetical protein